ncbi:MAG: putative addiction module antidote protein [Deltaproteobacteria bacterium]|nr:putative addiction module antidote protein [Deltaproteobacteria bacterium]
MPDGLMVFATFMHARAFWLVSNDWLLGNMSKTKTTRYDVAEHLRTPEEMAAYLEACLEEANGDAAFIAKALGDIARAKGMAKVARDAGLSRESLYKALSGERSPGFDTILKVMGALGIKLHAQAYG